MPTQITRQSLSTDLENRYKTQSAGGAFNAKEVKQQPVDFGINEKKFETNSGWPESTQGVSNFKNDGEGLSSYSKGLDTKPYKK